MDGVPQFLKPTGRVLLASLLAALPCQAESLTRSMPEAFVDGDSELSVERSWPGAGTEIALQVQRTQLILVLDDSNAEPAAPSPDQMSRFSLAEELIAPANADGLDGLATQDACQLNVVLLWEKSGGDRANDGELQILSLR